MGLEEMQTMAGILVSIKIKEIETSKAIDNRYLTKLATRIEHRGQGTLFRYSHDPIELFFYEKHQIPSKTPKKFYVNKLKGDFLAFDGFISNLSQLKKKYLHSSSAIDNNLLGARILLNGYNQKGPEFFNEVQGSFSGVIFNGNELLAFRDPVGSKPLYYTNMGNYFLLASELKALVPLKSSVYHVVPGEYVTSKGTRGKFHTYPSYKRIQQNQHKKDAWFASELNRLVKQAVHDNIRPGEKVSALLSGGIDSTIVVNCARTIVEDLHVYTVAAEKSQDLKFAKEYAKLHKLEHTTINISLDDMLEVLPDVIYALETFDAALIRSSVPMFIISREVKLREGSDVLLTGEGGDELFGGYSYLKEINKPDALNQELRNLLDVEYKTGLQRVDQIPHHFSIEAHAPLFDRNLVEFAFQIPANLKIKDNNGTKIEKWILRKAFEKELPTALTWRKKQKFSAGVGSQFILRDYFETLIDDVDFNENRYITQDFAVRSKEELYYWRLFNDAFSPTEKTISELGITSNFEI
ncbi:MAG: asparagine synthase-related protein [Promethearchaeota archaeon]